ncbi:Pyruvate, phosphate dikinase [Arachis hypogaea]|nr:Pyruvate, phosphate dikinase [Arachis hypogaea]
MMVVGAMVGREFDEEKIRTRQRFRHRVERTAATVSGVAAISEEGASDNKLTTLIREQRALRSCQELIVVRLICSNYDGTPSISFESSSAGAYKIADEAKFFSFGTNDLTQMTFGYSEDDVEKFLPIYLSSGIMQSDPFEVLDQKRVGQLIKLCPEKVVLSNQT